MCKAKCQDACAGNCHPLHLLGPRLRRLGLGRGLVATFFFGGASTAAAGALATTRRSAGDDHWHCTVLTHST